MKKFKPKYTEKTAIKKIRDILFTLSADAVKYTQMKINTYEIDSIDYNEIILGYVDWIIEFVTQYTGVQPIGDMFDQTDGLTDSSVHFANEMMKNSLKQLQPEQYDDSINYLVYACLVAKMLVLLRYLLFEAYCTLSRMYEVHVDWLPVFTDEFGEPVCIERAKLFNDMDMEIVYNIYRENMKEYDGIKLYEDGFTFLMPHELCQGIFLIRR